MDDRWKDNKKVDLSEYHLLGTQRDQLKNITYKKYVCSYALKLKMLLGNNVQLGNKCSGLNTIRAI